MCRSSDGTEGQTHYVILEGVHCLLLTVHGLEERVLLMLWFMFEVVLSLIEGRLPRDMRTVSLQ